MKPILEPHTEDIIKLYKDGKTCKDISLIYKTWPENVRRLLNQNCIKMNPSNKRKGTPSWSKGLKKDVVKNSVKLIESGEYTKLNEGTIRKHIKRFLINKNGHVCSMCDIKEWNSLPVPLICDHIDGNTNNSNLNNFRLVCCNCDAQLPTYKSKNRGKGRVYDKQYYYNKRA